MELTENGLQLKFTDFRVIGPRSGSNFILIGSEGRGNCRFLHFALRAPVEMTLLGGRNKGSFELCCVELAELVLLPLIVQNHEQLTVAIELHLIVSDAVVASQDDEVIPVRAACQLLQ